MITHYQITHMHIVPPIAVQLAKSPLLDDPKIDIRSVTGMTSGGAALGPPIIRELAKRTGVGLRMGSVSSFLKLASTQSEIDTEHQKLEVSHQ